MSFIGELKRRRVFRVASAYTVVAWIALQVADVLFPALHLPPWTVTIVAAVVIAGFPIVLILGWAFDITPGGIERTPETPGTLRFPVRAALAGTVLVTLGVGGFVGVRRFAVASRLDTDAVVVLPFRVAGDATLTVMREGMVDLMAAKLTGEVGPRAFDSRTTLSAWRRKIRDQKDDLPAADAVHLARSLGAGYVLLGEVVGMPGSNVAITATLYSAVDGRSIARVEESARPDSVLQLVDRVVAKLLTQHAGEAHHAEALLSERLSAVKAFLEGQQLYRRGNHFEAADRYKAALAEDSTFALAALGLALARGWSGFGADYSRGRRLAFTYRDRLPPRDREYLLAWVGENFPAPQSSSDRVRAWEAMVATSPDRAEAWYELGDAYYHVGSIVGYENSDQRAVQAWARAAALDSAFVPAIEHQFDVYALRDDTAQVRRLADLLFTRVQPDLKFRSNISWLAATMLRDEAWLAELRRQTRSWPRSEVLYAAGHLELSGLPQTDLDLLLQIAADKAGAPNEKFATLLARATSQYNRGRPAAGAQTLLALLDNNPPPQVANLVVAFATVYPEADSAVTAQQLARLEAFAYGPPPADPNALAGQQYSRCTAEPWRIGHGQFSTARETIGKLSSWAEQHPDDGRAKQCALLIDALAKNHTRAPDAQPAAVRLDSAVIHTVAGGGWREYMAVVSTENWLRLGDLERARKASMRVSRDIGFGRSTLVLERARLAARLGRRDEAIAAYQYYLKLRPDPEPGKAADNVAQARSEFAALTVERSR